MKQTTQITKRDRRHNRIRAKVAGTAERPRLAVYRSNRHMHIQLIDDAAGNTLLGILSKDIKGATPLERAQTAGKMVAEEAKKKGIGKVVFDRGGFAFRGRVKAVADGAREGGLEF